MDKPRQSPKYRKHLKPIMAIAVVSAIAITALASGLAKPNQRTQRVAVNSFTTAAVVQGHFEDKLKLRGNVSPQTSIYLDAVMGGRVEEKLVEQGQYVEKGQPLLRLSNVSLQLDVMSREAQVTEQLNFLRNTQMTMTTNRLNLRRDLLEIDLNIAHLNRQIKQSKKLVSQGVLAKDKLQALQLDLDYYQDRKTLTKQRQQQEEEIRQVQVQQLEESAQMLQKNLQFARNNLDNLTVKAPTSGYLSELNVELGESKSKGARLGQVDIPNRFKLVANIDEYYLNDITLDMKAIVSINGEDTVVSVTKIDSRVNNAQFRIEFDLPNEIANIKRGQNLDLDLLLSQGVEDSVLVKRGSFITSTGGQWVFVLDEDGTTATRRAITLGKKNKNYYQVVDGLQPGEKIITSNYAAFDKADIIEITGQKS